ncbi:hypothetical protein R3W88_011200 [Solanum pinnatisectum]|uniref:Mediator complex subunit 4 n=1 Tax=Solanum pinnatisectum TaxID=50273 RepID=A0AAV9L5J0_9SOLN|nr:hypothetical protein R3W88_011200 [Solanum pinnatisectum]
MLQNVPHQPLQSPARLGLPTPSSPSLQNPNTAPKFSSQVSQSHQPHQQANILTTTTTSSTLLPLLPPLSRAHAFRGSLPSFLPSVAPVPQDSCPSSSKEILSVITSLQTQLFEAVAELQEILDLQDKKQKLIREVRSKDSSILAFSNKLKEAERVLDMLVDDYSDYCRPKQAKLENDTEESSFHATFAPPEFGAGQAPLGGALPPAPQDEQLRASQLYNFADLDVGLPKTDEGKKIVEPLIEPLAETNPLANLSAVQGLVPPNIVVPSGWKPGVLSIDLPLPPPGWRPGDPIALPPVDSLSLPSKVEEVPGRAVPPTGLPRMPEPIQVQHVQLDIEDDSSDYSSDEASSDSED